MDDRAEIESPGNLTADWQAALDWWRDAGVDCLFEDTPRQWIVAPDPEASAAQVDPGSIPAATVRTPAPSPRASAMIGGDRALWPGDLPGFAEWWLREPSLDGGQLRRRVPPRGPENAALMVMVCEPEADDAEALLSGPHGRLLAGMLAAMGVAADEVYFASALPRHTPMPDWAEVAAQGLGEVLRHHLVLARPQRLIVFGRHIAPLLTPPDLEPSPVSNALTQTVPISYEIGQDGQHVPVMIARDLGSLLDRPIAKGHFWQHWLQWSAGS